MKNRARLLLKSIEIMNNFNPICIITLFIFTIFTAFLPILKLFVFQRLLNSIQSANASYQYMFYLVVLYTLLEIMNIIITNMYVYYNTSLRLKFKIYTEKMIFEKGENLPLNTYENSDTYDVIQRMQDFDVTDIFEYALDYIRIIVTFFSIISYAYILWSLYPISIPVIIIIPIAQFLYSKYINEKQYLILRNRTDKSRESWYYKFLLTSGNSFKELKVYDIYKCISNKYLNIIEIFLKQDLKIAKEGNLINGFLNTINSIIVGFLFLQMIKKSMVSSVLIGDIVTYMRSLLSFQSNITLILGFGISIAKRKLYFEQFLEFFELKSNFSKGKEIEIKSIEKIEVENLSFKYPGSSDYIFKNLNFTLNKGKKYALIGENGTGKTTLIKILLGLYDDYSGLIKINGIDLKKIDKKSYWQDTSVIFQDFLKFEGSLNDNIYLFNDDIKKNFEKEFEIQQLIKKGEDIHSTYLGYWFEKGNQLSAGEWQKVALCRAFSRKCSLLLLDEPNANLDEISDKKIMCTIDSLLKDQISIFILHRYEASKDIIDEYLYLKNGVIITKKNDNKEKVL